MLRLPMRLVDQIQIGQTAAAGVLAACLALGATECATAQSGNPLWSVRVEDLSATRDRPVFSPSRRPPPVAIVNAAPPPAPPPKAAAPVAPPTLTFFGTFESDEEVGAAIQAGASEKARIVRFGDYIDGWRVTGIDRHRLVLSLGERTAEFSVFVKEAIGAPPTVRQELLAPEPMPPLAVEPMPPPAATPMPPPPPPFRKDGVGPKGANRTNSRR